MVNNVTSSKVDRIPPFSFWLTTLLAFLLALIIALSYDSDDAVNGYLPFSVLLFLYAAIAGVVSFRGYKTKKIRSAIFLLKISNYDSSRASFYSTLFFNQLFLFLMLFLSVYFMG